MTDIHEMLERAVDVTIPVDVPADLRRGRARVRRERVWTGGLTAGLLVLAVGGYAGLSGGHHDQGSTAFAGTGASDAPTPTPTPTPTPSASEPSAGTYYDTPPAPAGWHLVGQTPYYAMIARDGANPPLDGGFEGKLMVLLSDPSGPLNYGTPIPYRGRTFHHYGDSGSTTISVELDDHRWLSVQYPDNAGFALDDMVAYLDAVKPLPGAEGGLG